MEVQYMHSSDWGIQISTTMEFITLAKLEKMQLVLVMMLDSLRYFCRLHMVHLTL
jgi:hypothetical protein